MPQPSRQPLFKTYTCTRLNDSGVLKLDWSILSNENSNRCLIFDVYFYWWLLTLFWHACSGVLTTLDSSRAMLIVICTFIAGVLAGFLSLLALTLRPQEGNGFISQGGATIFVLAGVFLFVFAVSWFPGLTIGYFVMRKSLSKQQKGIHIAVTLISAILFFAAISFVGHVILHRSWIHLNMHLVTIYNI